MSAVSTTLALLFLQSTLFFLIASLLAWRLLESKSRKIHFNLLGRSLFILVGAALFYLVSFTFSWSWLVIDSGSLLLLIIFFSQPFPKKSFPFLPLLLVACLLIAIPGSFLGYSWLKVKHQQQDATIALKRQKSFFDSKLKASSLLIDQLSSDPIILDNLQRKDSTGLTSYLQKQMVDQGTSFIIAADSQGQVLSRPQNPLAIGDTIFTTLPWSTPLNQGKTVQGFARSEEGLPLLVSGKPLLQNKTPLGFLLIGFYIDQDFLRTNHIGSLTNLAVQDSQGKTSSYSSNSQIENILQAPGLSVISPKASSRPLIQANGSTYQLVTLPLPSLDPDSSYSFTLLTLNPTSFL